jgi:hypothetical protein
MIIRAVALVIQVRVRITILPNKKACRTSGSPKDLACIAHKSLEIFERCRLWQWNSPATPENSAAFFREELQTVCSIHLF